MARVSIFLITLILLAGMLGCDVNREYTLTIASTAGGSVNTPGEGVFAYDEGTAVDLVAEADGGYYFVKWTGDLDTVDDAGAIETTITMSNDYSITANFEALDPGTLFAGGNGTGENPYQIANWSHLNNVRDYLDDHFILMNDLDSTTAGYEELAGLTADGGRGWQPIGTDDDPFTGTLDGQGFEITDLFVNRPADESFVGLFGYVDQGGVVGNIGMANVTVTGDVGVGGLVGVNLGTVSHSYSAGSVSGCDAVGGLVGLNVGNTSYCHSNAGVTGTGSTTAEVSGAGGLVGTNYAHISYCYSTGSVTGVSPVGGLVGVDYFGSVSYSYSTASVIGDLGVGGLVGLHALGAVSNSYATGSVTGTSYIGGLVGGNSFNGTVNNSYSCGSVTGGDSIGGLVGFNHGTATVSGSFWDTQASGQATSDGGTGKTTAEMQSIATFSAWNIIAVVNPSTRNPVYIWNIVDDETYPFLSWQS